MPELTTYQPSRLPADGTRLLDAQSLAAALSRPIVFVDLETTGADAQRDRITEIGVVEVGPDGIVEWETLLDPGMSIPPFIQRMTGISDDMVRGQPSFESLAESLAERLQGRLFVAHNARFDYGFLKNAFRRAGVTFRADVLCTVRLSRSLFPSVERHGLDALIARFGLLPKGRHRALADAELLWQFWQKIHATYSVELVEAAVRTLVRRASLPAGLEETALEEVPAAPGVYIFYGDQDVPLYVGKSVHLRQRIGAHFSGDYRHGKDMRLARLVRRVEWRETGGETGALLLEARLVKAMQPVHNQLLRRNTRLYAWELPQQLPVPRLRSDRDTDFCRHRDLFGVFGSRGAAEARLRALAEEHGLCLATLSLEKTTRRGSPCFARQVHRCAGACVGVESSREHRARLAAALGPTALVPWPFDGPVAWREQHGARAWWHVVDEWCYLGCADTLEEAGALAAAPAHFDLDTYQILAPRRQQWMPEAVPLSVRRDFALTPPQTPAEAPRAARPASAHAGRKSSATAGQQTLGLFTE
ncbi:DNA polymerase III, epsilon subunit + GIY-YIG endonuclease (modular protein) [Cupriavidus taiwanensis]|uniref:Excinuclease cho n=1 Tax=Cupriavidus taiwanensis TaxID=164546 RepID=A0A975X9F9_9BURK|nr:exonuclease domain-containing protein [Cupriavidus taiwanensis]SOY62437.1 DNA polymerase III, epsilon subunit + GIY-YIG endonuclease (modular protein) [Cupriavidus taiwanensis]